MWSTWPIASFLDIISAIWVAYGGWVTVSALLRRRPRDFARHAGRVVFHAEVPGFNVDCEFDETDAWKHVRESVNAWFGTGFLFMGAAVSILGRALPQGGTLDTPWLIAGLVIAGGSVGFAEWRRRRQIPDLVSRTFLTWLEFLTPNPEEKIKLGKLWIDVFDVAWQQAIDALKNILQREVDPQGTPTNAIVRRAVRTLGRECGWKPDELAWRTWLWTSAIVGHNRLDGLREPRHVDSAVGIE